VEGGRSVDTSMGLTPLEGLVMGTRSGDVDPALCAYLGRVAGFDTQDVEEALGRHGGLLALAGTGDMREVRRLAADGDGEALLARSEERRGGKEGRSGGWPWREKEKAMKAEKAI